MSESFVGMIKDMINKAAGQNAIACTVSKAKPLKLKFQGDKKMVLDKDSLSIPKHVKGLAKGKTVYVMPSSDGKGYIVLGKG